MAELAELARPYADAVYKLAKENDSADTWSEMLQLLSLVMSDEDVSNAAKNPRIGDERFMGLLLDICGDALDQQGIAFVKILAENKKLTLASKIKELYEARRSENEGYLDVDVRSAFPMTAEEQGDLGKMLGKQFGKKIRIQVEQDSSLIGGMIIRAGDKVIDGSVSGQIEQLAKQL